MEDNNYKHEEFDDCFLCKHPALKHLLTGLLIFLGAFAAFYVVSDWHFKRMFDPAFQMRKMDKAIIQRERNFDKMERKVLKQQQLMDKKVLKAEEKIAKNTAQFIHVEKTPDNYKIIIDLSPFDNNEKNVEVNTDGNTLIINAAGENASKHKKEILRYSQAFNFGEDIDTQNITKIRQGDEYVITVPFN